MVGLNFQVCSKGPWAVAGGGARERVGAEEGRYAALRNDEGGRVRMPPALPRGEGSGTKRLVKKTRGGPWVCGPWRWVGRRGGELPEKRESSFPCNFPVDSCLAEYGQALGEGNGYLCGDRSQ